MHQSTHRKEDLVKRTTSTQVAPQHQIEKATVEAPAENSTIRPIRPRQSEHTLNEVQASADQIEHFTCPYGRCVTITGQFFTKTRTFSRHISAFHPDQGQYKCIAKGCTMATHGTQYFIKHILTHVKQEWVCPFEGCTATYTSFRPIPAHCKSHGEGLFRCMFDSCKVEFSQSYAAIEHFNNHMQKIRELAFVRFMQDREDTQGVMDLLTSLLSKQTTFGQIEHKTTTQVKRLECDVCKAPFENITMLTTHNLQQHPETYVSKHIKADYVCTRCSYSHRRKWEVKAHFKKVHTPCVHCGKESSSGRERRRHRRICRGPATSEMSISTNEGIEEQFPVDEHDKTVVTNNDRVPHSQVDYRHEIVNEEERANKYYCPFPGCTVSYVKKAAFLRHARRHEGNQATVIPDDSQHCTLGNCNGRLFQSRHRLMIHISRVHYEQVLEEYTKKFAQYAQAPDTEPIDTQINFQHTGEIAQEASNVAFNSSMNPHGPPPRQAYYSDRDVSYTLLHCEKASAEILVDPQLEREQDLEEGPDTLVNPQLESGQDLNEAPADVQVTPQPQSGPLITQNWLHSIMNDPS